MIGAAFAVGCRAMVATVLALTAIWKLSNRSEFAASFERLAPFAAVRLARSAVLPVAAVELVLSTVLVAGIRIRALSLIGPGLSFGLIAAFTAAISLGDGGGCGCWATPIERGHATKYIPILRNLVLLAALTVAASLSRHGVHGTGLAAGAAPFVTGSVIAVLLVEAPQLVAVATFHRSPVAVEGER